MKTSAHYGYEKRIKSLQKEVETLRNYWSIAKDIFSTVVTVVGEGKSISNAWSLNRFKDAMP
jgi:hypothetical protein